MNKLFLAFLILFVAVQANDRRGPLPYKIWQKLKDLPPPERYAGKIVGGHDAKEGEIPFQVSWQYSDFDFHFCGGSILDEKNIMTAGHCCAGKCSANGVTDKTRIFAGGLSVSGFQDGGEGQERNVVSCTSHEEFDNGQNVNDICILHLDRPLEFNTNVQPVKLPALGETADRFEVSGWGTLSSGGSSPDKLQIVTVPAVSDEDCENAYFHWSQEQKDSYICAGDLQDGGVDSCQGDSGGPMFIKDGAQVGIVSWGYGCADKNYPGVYTQVDTFVDWIKVNMK